MPEADRPAHEPTEDQRWKRAEAQSEDPEEMALIFPPHPCEPGGGVIPGARGPKGGRHHEAFRLWSRRSPRSLPSGSCAHA